MPEPTTPDDATIAAEEGEWESAHVAGPPASEDEERAAVRAQQDPGLGGNRESVAEHYEEMTEKGANEKGEGRID